MKKIVKYFCGKVRYLLFRIVDFCHTEEEKEIVIFEVSKEIEKVKKAEHVLGFEDVLRGKILEIEEENSLLKGLLFQILILYRDGKNEELQEKLRETILFMEREND
ncbi:MAG: hypothetical protein KKE17_15735 [Proteobacteria bacterium]|nr:hypothetical protein [Pseudomonadota bacterium]MBU1901900.1 hypothetical protein [Patescibacteria group bacterium]